MTPLATFLAERHRPDACPCRKRHHVAPKLAAPDAPANTGKQARRFREAFDKLLEVSEGGDENEMAAAALAVPRTRELMDYAAKYEDYCAAMRGWSSDACGDCGKSLLIPAPTLGCARCLSEDAVVILNMSGGEHAPSR